MIKTDIKGKGILIGIFIAIIFLSMSARQEIIGEKSFLYENSLDTPKSLSIGDSVFSSSLLKYHCAGKIPDDINQVRTEQYSPPKDYNEPNCWSSTLTYEGKSYDIYMNQKIQLNKYLEAEFKPDGGYLKDEKIVKDSARVIFIVTLINKDFLETTISDYSTIILSSSPDKIPVNIRNDLAENIPGGLVVKTTYSKLQNMEEIQDIPMTFKKGINSYTVDLDTKTLGRQDIQLQPYFVIQEQRLYDDRVASVTYNIIQSISEVQRLKCTTAILCPSGYECSQLKIDGVQKQMCIPRMDSQEDSIEEITSPFLEVNTSIWVLAIILILIGVLIYKNRQR